MIAEIPPLYTNILDNYGLCFVTSLITVAAIFLTPSSKSFNLYKILGNN